MVRYWIGRVLFRQARTRAFNRFAAELSRFRQEGLKRLENDLLTQPDLVVRRSWNGCPLSYRNGYAGSYHGTGHHGTGHHEFTRPWDRGYIRHDELLPYVQAEIAARSRRRAWRVYGRQGLEVVC